jgi:two-component system KDP operon response regulator KdpE
LTNQGTAKKKILIVDDEPRLLRVLNIKFIISGYNVVTASSGRQALDLIGPEQPDIVLLDIIMPGIDGFQVLEKIRAESDVPVIAFSARPELGRKARSLGADDFLAKPFDVDDLVKRIQKVLKEV